MDTKEIFRQLASTELACEKSKGLIPSFISSTELVQGVNQFVAPGQGDRDEIGRALLANRAGRLGYCDLYRLSEGMAQTFTCDLRDKEQVRSLRSFQLFAGLVRANPTITCHSLPRHAYAAPRHGLTARAGVSAPAPAP